jgi:hypothetical protein
MDNHGEIIIYQTEDGLTKINVNMQNETVWLSLDQMAELFQRDKSTISRHIKNIFNDGELVENSVVANFATTASDGKRKLLKDSGKISHDKALTKAKEEYRRYQKITLSPVEEAYLQSIKNLEIKINKRNKKR